MNSVLISIIIPVYNAEKYIHYCLRSILNQTYCNFQVIIVNDGSTDNSFEICNEYAMKDNRFYIINKKNEGVSKARNVGLSKVEGRYVMFVDADDYIDKDCLKKCMHIIKCQHIDMLRFNHYKVMNDICIPNNYMFSYKELYEKIVYKDIFQYIFRTADFCPIWGCIIRSDIAKNVHFDENIKVGEDFLYNIECMTRVNTLFISNDYLYYYRINEESVTHAKDIVRIIEQLEHTIIVNKRIEKIINSKYNIDISRINKSRKNILGTLSKLVLILNYYEYKKVLEQLRKNTLLFNESRLCKIKIDKNMFFFFITKKIYYRMKTL